MSTQTIKKLRMLIWLSIILAGLTILAFQIQSKARQAEAMVNSLDSVDRRLS